MKAYLPFTGEFGGELINVVPRINGDPNPKVVFFEEGKLALYPSATTYIEIGRVLECHRGTRASKYTDDIYETIKRAFDGYEFIEPLRAKHKRKWFIPESTIEYDFKTDICIFPRNKTYRASMNWDGWQKLTERLIAAGLNVFAAGHRDSTEHLLCPGIWDFEENTDLDVSIHAIKNSKIQVGLTTALHLLGLMCGMPVTVLTTEDGRIHPKANAKPTLSFLDTADHKKVGYDIIPTFEIEGIVNEILHRCSSK